MSVRFNSNNLEIDIPIIAITLIHKYDHKYNYLPDLIVLMNKNPK